MAHAYTPGLRVAARTTIRSERRLPIEGEVVVHVGDSVQAADVVARADLPGNVQLVNVANLLSIPAGDIGRYILKKAGEPVAKDEVIARTKGIFGLFKSEVRAPLNGTIESISEVTGQVVIREAPIPLEVKAYINASVAEVIPREGAILEAYGAYIQGIFGVGGEAVGPLEVVVDSPSHPLAPSQIRPSHQDKILVGGSVVRNDAIQAAIEYGVKGIVAGGIHDGDLRTLLGYELGVAITGSEALGITLVITEGFGEIAIATRSFNLLKECAGMTTSINGATQIRAGVVRPEIIIPSDSPDRQPDQAVESGGDLNIGSTIRVIREPHFGAIGRVSNLPVELHTLETETKVRVLEAELEDGSRIVLPRQMSRLSRFDC